jgi:hypothetical protein
LFETRLKSKKNLYLGYRFFDEIRLDYLEACHRAIKDVDAELARLEEFNSLAGRADTGVPA